MDNKWILSVHELKEYNETHDINGKIMKMKYDVNRKVIYIVLKSKYTDFHTYLPCESTSEAKVIIDDLCHYEHHVRLVCNGTGRIIKISKMLKDEKDSDECQCNIL